MKIDSYIRPLQFRLYTPADLDVCSALYASNESGHVPAGYRPDFERWLADGQTLILVGESDGAPVACGGVAYQNSYDVAALTFGIVHSQHHRCGFGTTLLVARLALLEPDTRGCTVSMEVTSASFSFYRRFEFQGCVVTRDARGNCFGSFSRLITPSDVSRRQQLLASAGAAVPAGCEIPINTRPV